MFLDISFSSLCQFVAEKNLAAASHLGGGVGGTGASRFGTRSQVAP